MPWTPPPLCSDFFARASKALAGRTVTEKTVLRGVDGEPSAVLYVAEPSSYVREELAAQAVYHVAGIGRHCVQVVPVGDFLVRRLHSDWQPLALLASVGEDGWTVKLDASLLRRAAARIALLDYVLGNDGRHGWSVLLDKQSGRILSTDHGRCFGKGETFGECFRRQPLGDLHLTNDEAEDARRWWMGVEPLVMEALAHFAPELGVGVLAAVNDRAMDCAFAIY